MRLGKIFTNFFPGSTTYLEGDKMCARQVYRKLLITLLFLAFLSPTSHLFAATRGIQVVSKKGQSLYLYKDYHALVIGVGDYDHWPKLANAVKDARKVAAKLKEVGFEVKLVTDPDSRQLRQILANLSRNVGAEKERALLLYFAGHGETTKLIDGTDLGYIIPKDCPVQSIDPVGFDRKAISMKEIEMLSLKVKSKHMLMLFDSCFSGSLFSLSRAAPANITEKSTKPVRQFVTSGDADETVPDESVFAVCLLDGLDGEADYNRDRYITGSELGMYLQTKVINYSDGAQHPQYGKIKNPRLDKGDFIFILKRSAVTSPSSGDGAREYLVDEYEKLTQDRERLKAEKQLLEKEKQKLAYIPKTETSAKVSLRKESKILREDHVKQILKRYRFFDSHMNIFGSFENDLVDNGDGTVTDRATGLLWQKSGSSRSVTWRRAELYIDKLNRNQFAGYSDWRLPTIDELSSLLEKSKKDGLHIDPVFDRKQKRCWSSDSRPDPLYGSMGLFVTWIGNFSNGRIIEAKWTDRTAAAEITQQYAVLPESHVRLVRSLRR